MMLRYYVDVFELIASEEFREYAKRNIDHLIDYVYELSKSKKLIKPEE
jgi:hypothetical protein